MKKNSTTPKAGTYTCNEYREEMILLALQKRLGSDDLTDKEKEEIKEQIFRLEKQMGM